VPRKTRRKPRSREANVTALEHPRLWEEYWRTRTDAARNALTGALLPLAVGYARRIVKAASGARRVSTRLTEDETAVVSVALLCLVERYDPAFAALGTYVWWRVRGAVLDLWRKQGWFPRRFLPDAGRPVRMTSLDRMRVNASGEDDDWLPGALVCQDGMTKVEDAVSTHDQCLCFLRFLRVPSDELVIRRHYVDDVAFKDIAVEMGVTKQRVCFIHRRALARIKKLVGER